MAAVVIDGTTYKGYWKLTASAGEPDAFYLYPKTEAVYIVTISATEGSIKAGVGFDQEFDENTTGGNGEELDTAAKIAQYLSDYR